MSEDHEAIVTVTEAELIEPARRIVQRTLAKPWAPGQTGNPNGMSRLYHQCRKVFRDNSPELAEKLVELALNAEDERVRSVCLVAALDRAGIKPMEYNPDSDPENKTKIDVAKLTPEQRQTLRDLLVAAQK